MQAWLQHESRPLGTGWLAALSPEPAVSLAVGLERYAGPYLTPGPGSELSALGQEVYPSLPTTPDGRPIEDVRLEHVILDRLPYCVSVSAEV